MCDAGDVMDSPGDAADPVVVVRQPGRRPLHVVVAGSLQLGRDCDGLLIADERASRRHVELTATAAGVLVTDLGSRNGSFVDGRRITEPTLLAPGSILTLGNTTVRLDGGPAGPPPVFDPRRTSIDLLAEEVGHEGVESAALAHDGGTVTIVFSDIESSTSVATTMGDARWFEVLARHDELLRETCRRHRGTVVKNRGDGFMFTFPSARGAVRFMIDAQMALADWAAEDPDRAVRVRMGAHVGEAIHSADGDLFGLHVILASRIADLAVGGQVLVSSMVRALVASRGDLPLDDGTDVELKGLDGTHRVHEVRWPELA